MKAIILLEDGTKFEGISCGAIGTAVGELVFNTSMTGYQEVLIDPSYYGQIVVMTYPTIGNTGVNVEDYEPCKPQVRGIIMREIIKQPYNWRSKLALDDYLKKNNIVAVEGIDTRALTIIIRSKGTMNCVISSDTDFDEEKWLKKIKSHKVHDEVMQVTCDKPYTAGSENAEYHVALIDTGVKKNIIKMLTNRDCFVTVFPANKGASDVISINPHGIIIPNGPGDPKNCTELIENIKIWQKSQIPIFGICLGHQLVALANGADTIKLKSGHRGANHPVYNIKTGRTYITSQNHGYAVVEGSLDKEIAEVSFINLNDKTIEGVDYKNINAFTVQFYPQADAGRNDTAFLFYNFVKMMEVRKNAVR